MVELNTKYDDTNFKKAENLGKQIADNYKEKFTKLTDKRKKLIAKLDKLHAAGNAIPNSEYKKIREELVEAGMAPYGISEAKDVWKKAMKEYVPYTGDDLHDW